MQQMVVVDFAEVRVFDKTNEAEVTKARNNMKERIEEFRGANEAEEEAEEEEEDSDNESSNQGEGKEKKKLETKKQKIQILQCESLNNSYLKGCL